MGWQCQREEDPGDQDGDANRVLTHLLWSLVAKRFASNRTLRNFHYVASGEGRERFKLLETQILEITELFRR